MIKDKLATIKAELDNYISSYIEHLAPKNKSIDAVLDQLKNEEDSLREIQENLNGMLETIMRLMEIKVNANILQQHFLGCLKVAAECEDEMCTKIFVNQAFSTLAQTDQFLQAQLSEQFDVKEYEKLLNLIAVKENFEQEIVKSQSFIDDLEKIMKQLNELISEMPPAQY
ncbi:MAG: hypothetical protein ACTSRW_00885 [Candidatus Helarchaeota archaeon]